MPLNAHAHRRSLALALLAAAAVWPAPGRAQVPADPYQYSRSSSFTYRGDGLIETETIEPDEPSACLVTRHAYDTYGNRTRSTTTHCDQAPPAVRIAPRSSGVVFAAHTGRVGGPDGTAVTVPAGTAATTSTNAVDHQETRVVDPRSGAVVSLTGPNGLTTTWRLDGFGRPTKELRADGTSSVTHHCLLPTAGGRAVATGSNSAGCPTPDAAERPVDAWRFEHRVAQDAQGAAIGPFTRTWFDRAGRVLRVATESFDGPQQPGGVLLVVQDSVFDAHGLPVLKTQPYFLATGNTGTAGGGVAVTATRHDLLGRPVAVSVTDPSGPQRVDFGGYGQRQAAVTTIEYRGLAITTIDALGGRRVEEKNPDGRVVRVTDAIGAQLVHQHDAFGLLIATKDPLGGRLLARFDVRGRRVQLDDPDAGTTTECFDVLGQVKARQRPNQRGRQRAQPCPVLTGDAAGASRVAGWTTFAHDALGRVVQRQEAEYTTTWTFDGCTRGKGKLCGSATTHGLSTSFVYDSLGRPSGQRTDVAGGPSFASSVRYDSAGRVDEQRFPTGLTVRHRYTKRGALASLALVTAVGVFPQPTTAGGKGGASAGLPVGTELWAALTVDAAGRIETERTGNGLLAKTERDAAGRPQRLTAGRAVGMDNDAGLVDQRLTWDTLGRVSSRIDALGGGTGIEVKDHYTHDALGRLTRYYVSGGDALQPVGRTVDLQYNAIGMLLSRSDVGLYRYPAAGDAGPRHAPMRVGNTAYTYDLDGNTVSASQGAWRRIAYTSFGLPDGSRGIQGPSGSPQLTWQYDEDHHRIREDRVDRRGTRTTWMLHGSGLGFERETAPGGWVANRHYLNAGGRTVAVLVTSAPLATPGTDGDVPTTTFVAASKLEYWHHDHLGSLVATSDHTGAATARYAYDPFGQRRHVTGRYDAFGALVIDWTTDTNTGTDRGFTGHEHLDEVGLIHMNGRVYDPRIGRFLQADPYIQDPYDLQNFDRYQYCFNGPGQCIDPSGYSAWTRLRSFAIRTLAAAADAWGCAGFCSAAVGAYEGSKTGGMSGAILGAVTSYAGFQLGAQGASPSMQGFFAAVSGCAGAAVSGGSCAQGAAAGLMVFAGQQLVTSLFPPVDGTKSCLVPGCLDNGAGHRYEPMFDNSVPAPMQLQPVPDNVVVITGQRQRGWWDGYWDGILSIRNESIWEHVLRTLNSPGPGTTFAAGSSVVKLTGAAKGVTKYEVGTFGALKARSVAGDGLDIHHAMQKHPASQSIT